MPSSATSLGSFFNALAPSQSPLLTRPAAVSVAAADTACGRIGKAKGKGELVAVKTILQSHPRFNEADLRRELAVLEKVNHPRCVNLVEMVEDAAAFHFIEELGAGGELFDRSVLLACGPRKLWSWCPAPSQSCVDCDRRWSRWIIEVEYSRRRRKRSGQAMPDCIR